MKERIETIDIIRGIAALMVVFFHTLQRFPNCDGNILFHICFSVQIPLFFLISGYMTSFSKPINSLSTLWQHLGKRILILLIPWLVWSFLYYWLYCNNTPILEYVITTAYNMTNAYWFLISLWTIDIFHSIAQLISNNMKNNKILFYLITYLPCVGLLVFIGYLTSLKFLGIQYTLYYIPFFISGYLYAHYKVSLDKLLSKHIEIIIAILCIAYFVIISRFGYTNIPYSSYYILVRIILSIIGSVVLIVFVNKINWDNICFAKKTLIYAGKYSLEIYVLHLMILPLLKVGSYTANTILGFVLCILNFIIVFITVVLLIKLFNSNKYTRFILFGKK